MDERGKPPRVAAVREMADVLLAKREESTTPPIIGKCWVNNFVKRHDELESIFFQKYDYKQALCKDLKIIHK
jgi:hypothetical protein